jgi:hypothetical protein
METAALPPPWFVEAMKVALAPIVTRLDGIGERLKNIGERLKNSVGDQLDDVKQDLQAIQQPRVKLSW